MILCRIEWSVILSQVALLFFGMKQENMVVRSLFSLGLPCCAVSKVDARQSKLCRVSVALGVHYNVMHFSRLFWHCPCCLGVWPVVFLVDLWVECEDQVLQFFKCIVVVLVSLYSFSVYHWEVVQILIYVDMSLFEFYYL